MKPNLRAGKEVYLDAARLSAVRTGFYKLVFLSPRNNLIPQPLNGFSQGFQFC